MKRLMQAFVAVSLMLGMTAVAGGTARADILTTGTYTLTATVEYVINGTTPITRVYNITGDCATNTFTGTAQDFPGYTVTGAVTGPTQNLLNYTVSNGIDTGVFSAVFTGPDTFQGTGTDNNGNTFTFTGTDTNFVSNCVPVVPTTKEQCKNGGFANYLDPRTNAPFKNQGQCVSFVEHQQH
jgi:hypothetical protein